MKHRNDIDGLRAVAVLPILLFHAGVTAIPGGFIGVDIFFVISGFLITTIIVKEMDSARFSIVEFYRRRAVRIFPALIAMVAATLIWGCATMLPVETRALGHSAMAATLFVSNIFFFVDADYFASAAETKPLLHTWSLGVEEQFYLFFPLLLLLVRRYLPDRLFIVLVLASILSFVVGGVMAVASPDAAFYLLPSRCWELGMGAIAALSMAKGHGLQGRIGPAGRNAAAAVGIALIVAGLLLIRPQSAFPVPWAILPALGAMLLILYGDGTVTGWLLSTSPMRWIGKISYSLYLWHWPIITFYRLDSGAELDIVETAWLVAASIAAGALSYHLIEQPFLRGFRLKPRPGRIVAAGVGALALTAAGGLVASINADHWRSFDPQVRKVASYADYRSLPGYQYQFRKGECFRGGSEDKMRFAPEKCLVLSDTKRNMVVMGDSHAAQYWRAFVLRYPDRNVLQANASGCRPILNGGGAVRCVEVMRHVFGPMVKSGKVDTVILAGRWLPADLPMVVRTADYLKSLGIAVMVIGPTVEYEGEMPSLMARAMMQGDTASMARHRLPARAALDKDMAAAMKAAAIPFVSVYDIECATPADCRLLAPDGGPMQFDYGHLTLSAAKWVVSRMPPV